MSGNKVATTSKPKLYSLQALRAFAFLGIFTSHSGLSLLGAWGVSVFFILSGFVMCYSYSSKELDCNIKQNIKFAIGKVKGLYPLHIITMILAMNFLLYDLYHWFSYKELLKAIIKVVSNLTLFQSLVPREDVYFSLNGVVWYLSTSLFIYFATPYVLKAVKKYKSNKSAIMGIVVILAIQLVVAYVSKFIPVPPILSDNFSKWLTYVCPLYRLGDFWIGCNLCYLYMNQPSVKISKAQATFLEVLVIGLICVSQVIYRFQIGFMGSEWFRYTLLYSLTSMALIYLFAIKKGVLSRLSTNRYIIFIGNISAYTFLLHQIIMKYFDMIFYYNLGWNIDKITKAVICFVLTIVLSLLWKCIEIRMKKIRKKS